jgi:hypothetical protein
MVCAYLDESSQQKQDTFVLAGWVGSESMWQRFAVDWRTVLNEDPSIPSFRHTDAKPDPPKGVFAGLSKSQAEHKLRRLVDVLCSYDMYGVATLLRPSTFTKALASDIIGKKTIAKRLPLTHHYQACVLSATAMILQLQNQSGETSIVDFVLDEQTGLLAKVIEEYDIRRSTFPPALQLIAGKIIEGNDFASEPLQAADFLAGGITRTVVPGDGEEYYAQLRTCHPVYTTKAYPPTFEHFPDIIRVLESLESESKKVKEFEHWLQQRSDGSKPSQD